MSEHPYFDAVLIVAFGGPNGPADVRPFLENVLRGRRVSPERIEEVAHNYERFGGISPLTEITRRQANGLQERLRIGGIDLPVYVGMRNWHPYLIETLERMSRSGVRRAIGFIAAAHHSYSSCTQYKENVRDARAELRKRNQPDIEFHYVPSWFDHPLFIGTITEHVREALAKLPQGLQDSARIIFTAHSLPQAMAEKSQYRRQLQTTASMVMRELGREDWILVFQSRSGRLQDPWLEPDICDYLKMADEKDLSSAVIVPIGFLCDHIEVLYDLDTQAAEVCQNLQIPMVRAETTNDDPKFLDMMADVVIETCRRHEKFPPLQIIQR